MSPRFFIDRPIFASVLSIVIVVVGLVAMANLPVAQFPQITPPVVQIDADYPGASAETWSLNRSPGPIEVSIPGIDNLLYYDSTSTNDGHMTIRLTFEIRTTWISRRFRPRTGNVGGPQLRLKSSARASVKKTFDRICWRSLHLELGRPQIRAFFLANTPPVQHRRHIRRLPGVGDAIILAVKITLCG